MNNPDAAIFIHHRLKAENQEALFCSLAAPLITNRHVTENYAEELLKREDAFPTGLPVRDGVAIPHTDPTFVRRDAITFATLKEPVIFRLMGGDKHESIPVFLVILLTLTDGKKHLQELQQLTTAIQDEQFADRLIQATHHEQMESIVREKLLEKTT